MTNVFGGVVKKLFHTSSPNSYVVKKFLKMALSPKEKPMPPYQHVTQIGDPVLRRASDPVPSDLIKSNEIKFLIDRMKEVLEQFSCVGLAAPQVGIPLRVILISFPPKLKEKYSKEMYELRQMEPFPLTVMINPEMKILNYNKKVFVEGCASIRGYTAEVARYEEVNVKYCDENGISKEIDLKGWNARIAQHEIDHLNGKLYVDIMDPKTFTCSLWQEVNIHGGRIEMPFHKMT